MDTHGPLHHRSPFPFRHGSMKADEKVEAKSAEKKEFKNGGES
jgi:hypothetical protein